jgi:hypothetical protein
MFFESVVKLDAPIGGSFDQVDPAARRFRLEAQDAVRRALVQT